MMEAHLGVTTCDKCQEPMTKEQPVLVITEGDIAESDDNQTLSRVTSDIEGEEIIMLRVRHRRDICRKP